MTCHLSPPNPAHVYEFRNPVAKWHYKHIEIRNKVGNLEGRILKNDALCAAKLYCDTNTMRIA